MLFVTDTETTGLARFDLPLNDARQPIALEVSAALREDDGKEVYSVRGVLVRVPDHVQATKGAEDVHRISRARASTLGVRPSSIANIIADMSAAATHAVAYSAKFDRWVLSSMLTRTGGDPTKSLMRPRFPWIDVMLAASNVVRKPHANGSGICWPTLVESVAVILGRDHPDAHASWDDLEATWDLFAALRARGEINLSRGGSD